MKKLFIFVIIGFLLVGSFFMIYSPMDKQDTKFDYCKEANLFGLKYNSCNSLECIKFYEDIKDSIKKENCK